MTLPSKCSKCGTTLGFTPGAGAGRLCLSCLLGFGLKCNWAAETEPEPESGPDPQAGTLTEELGRYRLLEKIGEGGCGVVYRAEQREPVRRRVAIKVIKLGMDSRDVIARFEQERQALALMEHPGIAKVFDGGTTSTGRPYFVMELVAGEPITAYCQHRRVDLAQRLRLFIELCQAVQHAHHKGIIHRDLKPSNVLVKEVNGIPHPKVIDFGVARATSRQRLATQTLYTAFDQFVGTPAYMSPEQAGLTGEDADPRSDIYSLGVLLYELLTGTPPFDPQRLHSAALDEVCRIIREVDPVKPSTRLAQAQAARVRRATQKTEDEMALRPAFAAIPSDLDWIVLKALQKQPAGRYATAQDFASDLERHLNGQPVTARAPGVLYQLQKRLRRNKLLCVAAAAVFLAFLTGCGGSTWRLAPAPPAPALAAAAGAPAGPMAVQPESLSRRMGELLPAGEGNASSPESLLRLAEGLIAREKPGEAEAALREAVSILRNRHEPADSRLLGAVLLRLTEALHGQKKWSEGEAMARDTVTLWRQHPEAPDQLLHALHWQVIILVAEGRFAEAEPLEREALQLCDQLQASGVTLPTTAFCFQLRCELGNILFQQRKLAEAEPLLLAAYEGLQGKTSRWDVVHEQLSLELLAELCTASGRPQEAAQWRQKLAKFTQRAKPPE